MTRSLNRTVILAEDLQVYQSITNRHQRFLTSQKTDRVLYRAFHSQDPSPEGNKRQYRM